MLVKSPGGREITWPLAAMASPKVVGPRSKVCEFHVGVEAEPRTVARLFAEYVWLWPSIPPLLYWVRLLKVMAEMVVGGSWSW